MKYLFFISAILLLGCSTDKVKKRLVKPTNGYAQMVVVEQNGTRTLHISGQIGDGADLESQMRDVLRKLKDLLASEGGSYADLVKINTYIVNYQPSDLDVFRNVRKEIFTNDITPASTLVGVTALALPAWLIEIDAVAVIEQ